MKIKTPATVTLLVILVVAAVGVAWWARSDAGPQAHSPRNAISSTVSLPSQAVAVAREKATRPRDKRGLVDNDAPIPRTGVPEKDAVLSALDDARARAKSAAETAKDAGNVAASRNSVLRAGSGPDAPLSRLAAVERQWAERETNLFFKAEKLDEGTREQIVQLVEDRNHESYEIGKDGFFQGMSEEEITRLRAEVANRYREKLIDIIGEEQIARYFKLESATLFAPIAEDLAARCEAQGEPLAPAVVVDIALNLSKNLPHPRAPAAPVLPNGVPVNEFMAFKEAAKVLTPGQLLVFKKLWAERPYPPR
jgi:hypothetical protein